MEPERNKCPLANCSSIACRGAAAFSGSPHFRLVRTLTADAEMAPMIDHRNTMLVLQIEPHFTKKLAGEKPVQVQFLLDGRNSGVELRRLIAG
jgi:hypothetical protein